MAFRQQLTSRQLILRCFRPSAVSGSLCLLIAVLFVGANVILQSVNVGTALPGILDGQWAIAYTEHVVQPLTEILSSNTLNKFLVALLWGGAGFLVYIGFEFAIHTMQNVREDRGTIRMARGHVIEQAPASSFWPTVYWRLGVILAGIMFLVLVQPLLRNALGAVQGILFSTHLINDSLKLALAALEWAFIMHGFVVFLRLYTMRTRLFGDDQLY